MADPQLSVVIPCYRVEGREGLLRQALESIMRQTYRDLEIVVVNDGSPDRTEAIARALLDRLEARGTPTRYVHCAENRGTSVARNRGIAAARGRLVAFLDFDDLYLPGFLEAAVAHLDAEHRDPVVFGATIYYRRWRRFQRAHASPIAHDVNEIPFADLCGRWLAENFPIAMGSAIVCRRELFEPPRALSFDEFLSRRTAEDVCFGYEILLQGIRPFVLAAPQVIHRRYYGGALTSRALQAYVSADELEVFDYLYAVTMRPLLDRIAGTIGEERAAAIEAQLAETRAHFEMKSYFVHGRYRDSLRHLGAHPRLAKSWLRFGTLALSRRQPLAFARDAYLFWSSPNDPAATRTAVEYLASL